MGPQDTPLTHKFPLWVPGQEGETSGPQDSQDPLVLAQGPGHEAAGRQNPQDSPDSPSSHWGSPATRERGSRALRTPRTPRFPLGVPGYEAVGRPDPQDSPDSPSSC